MDKGKIEKMHKSLETIEKKGENLYAYD